MRRLLLGLAALALACSAQAAPAPADAMSPQARWEAGQAAYEAWSKTRPGWHVTASGLQYKRIKRAAPWKKRPEPGAVVTIHYVGTFIDGTEFDSSRKRGEPATFPLNQLIQGWREGVPLMRKGERFLFVIPAPIGYGARTRPPIHPNSTLLFDIELIDIPKDE